jgi:hypothetical protein
VPWTCPHCGAAVDDAVNRCWSCRQTRPDSEPQTPTVPRTAQEPDPQVSTADAVTDSAPETDVASESFQPTSISPETAAPLPWLCPKCGETVDAGFLVCWSCGCSIEGVEDPTFASVLETAPGDDESRAITFLNEESERVEPISVVQHCAHCQSPLEPGFIADFQRGQYTMTPSEWVAGSPQPSFWTGTWTGDRRFPIQAFRCTQCGHLEFWANEI